ncbi:hypothetical protein TSAR_012863 [Trichomalopsis sarcophagae]|uniref:DALR anticodon binding domain-containing protein n=1 Tax=Trichomalopsis sarcophagae TaxID=543379 RepID=A0A232FCI0_9HYME|nr:hypothetical protein TSAR_012863 [Trichomalopsis sarcophagae]
MAKFLYMLDFRIHQNLVHIKYLRGIHAVYAIKAVYTQGKNFGINEDCGIKVKLGVEYAEESELTNLRLDLLKKVSTNLLKAQGFNVQDEVCDHNYVFTIKSVGKTIDKNERYVCGAVVNSSKKKEKCLTVESYMQNKISKVKELCDQRHPDDLVARSNSEEDIKKIADASVSHELLSTKHISTVMLKNFDNIDKSVKEGSYILYNNVRMNAVLDKYAQLLLKGEIPQIPEVENLFTFSTLDIEEWNLFYNYIIKYPDVLKATVTFHPKLNVNVHLLWSFVSSLCHEFSRYYEKNRFLMPNPTFDSRISELCSERLHLLRSLRIILRNSLALLEVEEVQYM